MVRLALAKNVYRYHQAKSLLIKKPAQLSPKQVICHHLALAVFIFRARKLISNRRVEKE